MPLTQDWPSLLTVKSRRLANREKYPDTTDGLLSQVVVTVNPATGEKSGRYRLLNLEEVNEKLRKANTAFSLWKDVDISERASRFLKLASALRSRKKDFARLITEEMGKPINQSEAEIEKCAWTAEVYARKAEMWLADEEGNTDAQSSFVTFQPLGTILSIMPWNFPFWQVFRFAIPSLIAGNVTILRHSNQCPGCSLAIEDAFHASFPDGVFTSVFTNHQIVRDLIQSPLIRGVSFTGSVEAGKVIATMAAESLKKCVLELGGSDPFVVLEDADVFEAARIGADARLICSGQSCIAAKRFIVVEDVAKEFSGALVEEFKRKNLGDPMNPETDVGPLANDYQVSLLDEQVSDAISKGARPLTGGKKRPGNGAFYELTVLDNVALDMRVMKEEVFGPVAPIYVAKDEETALKVANDTDFGLGASLWTRDISRAKKLASRIESGVVFVNEFVKSDPRMPFGGIKNSGLGRELSKYGLKEFTNIKSINLY